MGFLDKLLEKVSTKKPDEVAKGDTVLDGWYMLGKEDIIEKEPKKTPTEEPIVPPADAQKGENTE